MPAASLKSRSILITGANTGIGRSSALALAERGARLYLAGRSEARHAEVLGEIRAIGAHATYLPLDLGDFSSIRACAARFLALEEPLHVLVNNAGLAGSRGLTHDGFERTFGVNYLGPFLLTELLLPRLKSSAPSRVVNVASKAHFGAKAIDWALLRQPTRSRTGFSEYELSKLCNVLHAIELSRRLQGTTVNTYSLHPGMIASDVWRNVPWGLRQLMLLFMKSNAEGARTTVYCAASEQVAAHTGQYYDDCRAVAASALASDAALARELYDRSLQWVGLGKQP
jgi:retinol dehydrogenase-12